MCLAPHIDLNFLETWQNEVRGEKFGAFNCHCYNKKNLLRNSIIASFSIHGTSGVVRKNLIIVNYLKDWIWSKCRGVVRHGWSGEDTTCSRILSSYKIVEEVPRDLLD